MKFDLKKACGAMKLAMYLIPIIGISTANAATTIENSKVIDVAADLDYGVVYVKLDNTQTGEATSCADPVNNYVYQISNLDDPISKALLATSLTALSTGKPVKAVGKGDCVGRAGIERLRLLSFLP